MSCREKILSDILADMSIEDLEGLKNIIIPMIISERKFRETYIENEKS